MSGAPISIGPPGSKVRSLLPVKNLLQAPVRDIARTTAETPEHAIFECTIRIPKSAVGRIIGTKGSSKKVLEQQLGEEFQLESVLDPAVLRFKGTEDKCKICSLLVSEALTGLGPNDMQVQLERAQAAQVTTTSQGLSVFDMDVKTQPGYSSQLRVDFLGLKQYLQKHPSYSARLAAAATRVAPSVISFSSCSSAYGRGVQWQQAIQLLRDVSEHRLDADLILYNASISTCEKAGQCLQARRLLREMEDLQVLPASKQQLRPQY
ncbi:hypothetical protein AK812_SmicGene45160 [Symbiodinium microadriaticum]|uniref:K Homology domain-containing protein n=1 Tax=Symbiodinium microadriaticum TaxID=2951 RepID=A0A1Q9BWM1_SYMMI|nr:hypothetical protein AK812_SmicGene45160 [Symbiodinium microadriaticum]